MRSNIAFVITTLVLVCFIYFTVQNGIIKNILEFKKINKIELIDNKQISKDYFFAKISVREGQSFWIFNPFKLKKELESFNEIKKFSFNLNWNGTLEISILEKRPFMKWVENNREVFIDHNGNILKLNIDNENLKIIVLYGKDANIHVASIKKVLVERSKIFDDIKTIIFQKTVGWTISFKDGNCILLPLKKLDKVIDIFQNVRESEIYNKFNYYDLRISGRVYMSNKKC